MDNSKYSNINLPPGKREHFYPMYELLEGDFLKRVAKVMTTGMEKYGRDNWKNFNEEQIQDIPRHAFQHIVDYMSGKETGEDDLAHAACNIMMSMWYEDNAKTKTS